jgi:hypothetical protein
MGYKEELLSNKGILFNMVVVCKIVVERAPDWALSIAAINTNLCSFLPYGLTLNICQNRIVSTALNKKMC